MTKVVTLLKAPEGMDRAAFQNWYLERHAPALDQSAPQIRRLVVSVVNAPPERRAWERPGEQPSGDPGIPAYDIVAESWFDGTPSDETLHLLEARAAGSARPAAYSYRVTEWIEKDEQKTPAKGRSPGAKYMVLCRFHDDLPVSAGQRSWANHVPLALRVHAGMAKYVRNWVEEPLSPGAPRVDGIGELHFATLEDMEQRWFSSPAGRDEVIQDLSHFLASGVRLYTTEHVVK